MSADLDQLSHVFRALEPRLRKVRQEPSPLERCFCCDVVDQFGDFKTDTVNGRHVVICDECERQGL